MNVGWGNGKSADESVSGIIADAVLVSVMADAVLLDPAGFSVLLAQPVWLVQPLLWNGPILDGLVLIP